MLALSVRQPWTHALVHLGKDIENRKQRHRHRGLTLLHASAGMTTDEYLEARAFMLRAGVAADAVPNFVDLLRGGIIGAVEIVDCVTESGSPWWMGPRGFVCRNARPIPFIACKGTVAPLFWTPPPHVQEHCRRALATG